MGEGRGVWRGEVECEEGRGVEREEEWRGKRSVERGEELG